MGASNIEQISIGEDELEEYALEYIPRNALCIIYNYKADYYEGSGWALIKYPEGWDEHNMGHCSCYGPMEEYRKCPTLLTLDQIAQNMSKEARTQIDPVLIAARKWEELHNGTK